MKALIKSLFACILVTAWMAGCSAKKEKAHEITEAELTTDIPALGDLHEAIYPLWHDAYPNKDLGLIKNLLPRLDSLTARLDAARLPGILADKKENWDLAKLQLKASLDSLHIAAAHDNGTEMLRQAENIHSGYAKLVRVIRPLVPELEAFHRELYKLYHAYMPEYQLDKIRESAQAMQEKAAVLKGAVLFPGIQDRKERFDAAVLELEKQVQDMAETVKGNDRKAIQAAVEKLHDAYVAAEGVFN